MRTATSLIARGVRNLCRGHGRLWTSMRWAGGGSLAECLDVDVDVTGGGGRFLISSTVNDIIIMR